MFQWVTSGSGEWERINNITYKRRIEGERRRRRREREELKEKRGHGISSGKREWGRIKMEKKDIGK